MKLLTILITLISIILIVYLIKKFFSKKKEKRVFEGEFEEIDDQEG